MIGTASDPVGRDGGDLLVPGREIIFLDNSYTTVPEPSGGARHAIEMARRWISAGQPLSIMTTEIGIENLRLDGFDGPLVRLPWLWPDRLSIPLLYLARSLQAVFHLPWRRAGTILYGTSDMLPDVIPAFLYRLLRKDSFWAGCVFHLVPPPSERAGSGLANRLSHVGQGLSLRMMRSMADMVIVDNVILEGQLAALGFRPESLLLTNMGTDLPVITGGAREGPEACYVGRLHPSKGVFELVEIWKEVVKLLPGSRLAVAGAGPEQLVADLERAFDEAGLGELVELLGYVSREELERLLSSSKVFVSASREEGFGISVVEAMSYGLPAVVSGLPHFSRLFGDALIQVQPGDVSGFAEKVVELLSDDRLRKATGRRSRELASRFTWRDVTTAEAREVAMAARARGIEDRPLPVCCPSCLERGDEVGLGDLRNVCRDSDSPLTCPACGESYPVKSGIPVLLTPGTRREREPNLRADDEHQRYETNSTRRIRQVIRRLSTGTCLDVGCGKGPYSECFNGDLVLTDINHYFVSQAVGRYGGSHRVMGVVADAACLPFPPDTFDFVFCSSMLEHLPPADLDRAVESFKALSRGKVLVDVPNESGAVARLRRTLHRRGVFEDREYRDEALDHHVMFSPRMLRSMGFTVRGCIGWTSREAVRLGALWDLYDALVYRAPSLAGTLIGIHEATRGKKAGDRR